MKLDFNRKFNLNDQVWGLFLETKILKINIYIFFCISKKLNFKSNLIKQYKIKMFFIRLWNILIKYKKKI